MKIEASEVLNEILTPDPEKGTIFTIFLNTNQAEYVCVDIIESALQRINKYLTR